jgi:hypothetical protein
MGLSVSVRSPVTLRWGSRVTAAIVNLDAGGYISLSEGLSIDKPLRRSGRGGFRISRRADCIRLSPGGLKLCDE